MYRNESGDYDITVDKLKLINTFRKLWEQHGVWTRSFIISEAEGLGDLELVTNRLLRNPADFGEVLKEFYGVDKANNFKSLLEQHLLIAADLVKAAKAGSTEAAGEAKKKWYHNADEIAALLGEINPYWKREDWQGMLYNHLKLVESEAVNRLGKQYAKDIEVFDQIEDQALDMADEMAKGIITQFNI
ncbi:acetylglutamate kinase [Clostridium sp. SHJSY1]|uniref:acetylglutamate kinase n=1 Tax=Clostridium sp. SHJSY1 TaxID=2942483 RepID=UPI002876F8D7|nr:acetylglutamate kinase [Clostridium sp. SHJSY1]MDS0524682.1 acetylglutamate kinase [Clostridium sp. SHJSY1]